MRGVTGNALVTVWLGFFTVAAAQLPRRLWLTNIWCRLSG